MMLAFNMHRTCLRSVIAHFLTEAYTGTFFQLVKISTKNTVTVKIYFPTIRCFDYAVVFMGKELFDSAMGFDFMYFDFVTSNPYIIF